MAANPRLLASDTTVTWDGVQVFFPKGTIIDVPAGSALETAYGGSGNLVSLGPTSALVISGDTEPEDTADAGGGTG
jgi:hypothetical protein